MGRVKSFFHEAVEPNPLGGIPVYVLMEGNKPVGVYTDKALADKDCWLCNEAQKYLDMEQFNYWVSTSALCTDSPA
jgi:hypothetical protein